jgi:hypothetical protein
MTGRPGPNGRYPDYGRQAGAVSRPEAGTKVFATNVLASRDDDGEGVRDARRAAAVVTIIPEE